MGRGPRNNQAINIAATPRLLRRPQRVGQKRYLVYREDPKLEMHREPGYIVAGVQGVVRPFENSMIVAEEIAVEGGDGKLYWVPKARKAYRASNAVRVPLHDARRAANCFNKFPLGPVVSKEIDSDGNLVIGYGSRETALYDEATEPGSDFTRIRYQSKESFDVTDPAQAQQAAELFAKLEEQKALDEISEGQAALKRLARSENKKERERAEEILRPAQDTEKIRAAKRFAEALEEGNLDEVEAEIKQKQAVKDEAEDKRVASRMQETLRSLGQS